MDDLSKTEGLVLLSIGNTIANSIWEAGVATQKGWNKPKSADSRKTKEDWIKSKYQWKGFLEYKEEYGRGAERERRFNEGLYQAAKDNDVCGVAEAIAKGGSVDWKNVDDDGRTALHVCVMSVKKDSEESDEDSTTLSDDGEIEVRRLRKEARSWHAIVCAELLIQNGAKVDAKDDHNHGVLDCAVFGDADRAIIEYLSARV